MSTDREELLALLDAVDRLRPRTARTVAALVDAADRARRHLLLTDSPDGDCRQRIEQASTAAYAAGEARGTGAAPDRLGNAYPGPAPGTVDP